MSAACWRWPTIGCTRSGDTLTEALRTGLPQNEISHGVAPGLFEGALCRPGAAAGVPVGDVGPQPGRQHDHRAAVPVEDYATFVDVGTAQGDLAVQVAWRPAPGGLGFDLPEVAPIFEDVVAAGVADRVTFTAGTTDDLPKTDVVMMGQIARLIPAGGAPDRLRGDHRQRPVAERVWPPDEPEHAHRDAGRLRLYRRRLRGWMREAGFTSTRVEPLVGPDSMVSAPAHSSSMPARCRPAPSAHSPVTGTPRLVARGAAAPFRGRVRRAAQHAFAPKACVDFFCAISVRPSTTRASRTPPHTCRRSSPTSRAKSTSTTPAR